MRGERFLLTLRCPVGIDRREPAEAIGDLAVDVGEELLLNPFGDRTAAAAADRNPIDAADRRRTDLDPIATSL